MNMLCPSAVVRAIARTQRVARPTRLLTHPRPVFINAPRHSCFSSDSASDSASDGTSASTSDSAGNSAGDSAGSEDNKTASSSSKPNETNLLWAPWQPLDLRAHERDAWVQHGVDCLAHMNAAQREVSRRGITARRHIQELSEFQYGPDWYDIIQEANDRLRELTETARAQIQANWERRGGADNLLAEKIRKFELKAWSDSLHWRQIELREQVAEERKNRGA